MPYRFDLTAEPWVRVLGVDGRPSEVSLVEAFERAGEIRAVVGDLPTQAFALVRLMLAVLHRATEGPTIEQWARLWDERRLPVGSVSAYLERFRDRFDLLHPATPFYQVADLRTTSEKSGKVEWFGLDRLIADVPNGLPYFTMRLKRGVERIGFGEAARWLVHAQAWDPSGIKSGASGDTRVKGGKGYPIGTAWAGNLGGIYIEGRDLVETLLLNLIPVECGYVQRAEDDRPAWEREPDTATEDSDAPGEGIPGAGGDRRGRPSGPVDLYTWQSRRIRLFATDAGVHGVLIANGDRLQPQNRHRVEPMTAWRRSNPQERKHDMRLVYMPRTHDPDRAIWRSLGALLPSRQDAAGRDAASSLAPAVLEWLAQALVEERVPPTTPIRPHAIGMTYGSQSATTEEIVDDQLAMTMVLLRTESDGLGLVACDAVEDAEKGVQAYQNLVSNLARARGGDSGAPRSGAAAEAYAELDGIFRSWLARLGPGDDADEVRETWQREAARALRGLGLEQVRLAGPVAWVGKADERGHIDTCLAEARFMAALRKVFPWGTDEPSADGETRDDETRDKVPVCR